MRDIRVWAMLMYCAFLAGLGIIGLMGMGGIDNVLVSTTVLILPHFFDPNPMGIGLPIMAIGAGAVFATATIVSVTRNR